jgi:thymidine phosphorylase
VGALIEKNAGVDLIEKVADKVKKSDTPFIIYASFKSDFEFSTQFAHENSAYVIAPPPSTDDNYFI